MAQITSKELSGISDQLAIEQNLIAKFKNYAETTQDTTLKAKYNDIAQKHQKHFDALYSNLK
ncbi:MAG: hypothetical protein GX303_00105 [Clostridiales bacterium]|nr:hypothetical protein [Clostridiales bacterium]